MVRESYRLNLSPLLNRDDVDLTKYFGGEVIIFRSGRARNLERGILVEGEREGHYGLKDEMGNVSQYRSADIVAFIIVSQKE